MSSQRACREDPTSQSFLCKGARCSALRSNNHVVGFMGDGINDAAAMRSSDVGIPLTPLLTWQRVRRYHLLQKDLLVLEHGVEESQNLRQHYQVHQSKPKLQRQRRCFKASFFLPLLPASALQLLLLNWHIPLPIRFQMDTC